MSIWFGVIVVVAFQKIDRALDTETCTECYYQSLQYTDCTVKKCYKFVLLCPDPKYSWWITGPSVMKNVDITKALLEAACAPAAGEGQKNSQN